MKILNSQFPILNLSFPREKTSEIENLQLRIENWKIFSI